MTRRGFSLATLALLAGCARRRRVPAVRPLAVGYAEIGVASWYGHPYHGRRAASGEIYDMEKFTAAHRTLPFGARVRVENLDNGRQVEVRINDRGPFVEGRIIDLSRAAARSLGMLGPGTARVRLVLVGLPGAPGRDWFAVQTGAFRDRSNAERQRRWLEDRYGEARIVPRDGDPVLWRVLVGRTSTREAAEALAARLRAELGEAFVVRLDEPPGDHL
ncbi:MAG: septal ring lytic transglycosylase RlpA family protein [Bryobacterales bacterium]|nr:septal ring lytic transglycosylase RlpA family protein [Bryobacterales bacterium]